MDPEGRLDVPLLSPPPERFHSVKVFPYIVHLKRDIIVSVPGINVPLSVLISSIIPQRNIGLCTIS